MTDIRSLDRRTLEITQAVVGQVRPDHLDRPTPCAEWTVRQLLAHMTGQNYGFAAAADGIHTDRSHWADRDLGSDPAAAFRASATRVTDAFARDGVLDTDLWLPEVRGGQSFPARTAIGFHFVDYVVHGWDVAAAIAVPAPFDEELLHAVLPYALDVPEGEVRLRPGAAFSPGLATDRTDPLARVLAVLGRSPSWPH
ncbi:TIGR03086 family metal-binding protein [Streptacidiphilus sp. PB12-B1b]|uniref:TIGR03086 family metal-binding protein n=1 Tax=Streptacidiphilus sp. PB12-B1b TaxID=2705012 RepID=UPI001CDCF0BB|nr:TIGR03086 family metal-binding protein [Streptacidiphilus sp. PB12-B1b]